MSIKLYTLKSEQGYIRCGLTGCEFVGLDKATVYPSPGERELKQSYARAVAAGVINLRLAELTLKETDHYCVEPE